VTPDGCPVEAYRRLPPEPELAVVLEHAPPAARILDLGAGTGRIADPLARRGGYDVLAVDESAEVLACIRHARTLRSPIEDLHLAERFDLVLLLSHLVNRPDAEERRSLLATAARHLAPGGTVLVQRHPPHARFAPATVPLGAVTIGLCDVDTTSWPLVSAVTTYEVNGQSWRQSWTSEVLDDRATGTALAGAGLRIERLDGAWVVAMAI
jgi:SAM-dependent methyltransferase